MPKAFVDPVKTTLVLPAILVLTMVIAGCSDGSTASGPRPVPAAGMLTYNATAVPDATISLIPNDPSQPGAVARSDSTGAFKLTTGDRGEGAMPGDYKVSVTAIVYEGGENPGSVEEGNYNPNAKPATPKYIVPQKFSNPETSGLTLTIPPEGTTDIKLDLK